MKIIGRKSFAIVGCLCLLICSSWARADTGVLTWNPNTESDLAGYKVYRSTTSGVYGAPLATLGKVITYNIDLPKLAVDTRYFVTVTAYDLAGNESQVKSNEVSKVVVGTTPIVTKPGTPVLTVSIVSATAISVTYPPVSDGAGGIAKVNVRYAPTPISWGSAPSATCTSSPCVITGLPPGTKHDLQAVAYRPGVPNVFGSLSAIVSGTTLPADTPPAPPSGLTLTKNTVDEIIIVAKTSDCGIVTTVTDGSTVTQQQRTIRCVR